MKVGVIGFAKAARDLFPEEESYSGSAITNAFFFKYLVERWNAELIFIGKVNKRTKALYKEKQHVHQWAVGRVSFVERVPRHLDLIVVMSSDDNPTALDNIDGIVMSKAYHMYRVLAMHDRVPVIYLQTDFGTPLRAASEYRYKDLSSLWGNVYRLYRHRKLHVLATGLNEEAYTAMEKLYKFKDFVAIHFTPPDFHFITDLDYYRDVLGYRFPVPATVKGAYYGGKDRRFGSRAGRLAEYLAKGATLYISGKWRPESLRTFEEQGGDRFRFLGDLPSHHDVLTKMNEVGASLYISNSSYDKSLVITGRLRDSLLAGCIPLIDESARGIFLRQWQGYEDFVNFLTVTPDTLCGKLQEIAAPEVREKLHRHLWQGHQEIRRRMLKELDSVMETILSNPKPTAPLQEARSYLETRRKASKPFMQPFYDFIDSYYESQDLLLDEEKRPALVDKLLELIEEEWPAFRPRAFKELLEEFIRRTEARLGRPVSRHEWLTAALGLTRLEPVQEGGK